MWGKAAYRVVLCSLLLSVSVCAEQLAHDHQGILVPYQGEPPEIVVSEQERQTLEEGRPVYKKIDIAGARRGIALFRVNASANVIWSVISDFASYPAWVADIDETEIYRRDDGLVYVRFVANHWFAGQTVWYAQHDYPTGDRNWGTWQLDYTRRSDLDDSVGFWRVLPVEGAAGASDVIYSADLKLKGWIPGFIESSVITKGLKEATAWVKEQAEARAAGYSGEQ